MSAGSVTSLDHDIAEDPDFATMAETWSPLFDAPVRLKTLAILVIVLPLFGQTFSYMKDLLPLWAFSKAFPLLSLPLAGMLLRYPRMPMTRQILLSFFWLVLCPSFAAIFYFRQDFFVGVAAQVKLLPILYFFSFLALLFYVRPSLRELAAAFLGIGAVMCLVLVILWAVVPASQYSAHYVIGSSPLFTTDNRGNRIRMPMYFGIVAVFFCYRHFLREPKLKWFLGAAIGFGLIIALVRTRSTVLGIAAILMINGFIQSRALVRGIMLLVVPLGLAALFSFSYVGSVFSTDSSSGFDVRWETATKAVDFLGVDPLRWLFGVGTISPTSADSLFSFFDHFFFLADITWLGIVFEFGLLGAALVLFFELRGLFFYARIRRKLDSVFLGSLFDYVLYAVLISNLYPLTLTPGESAVIFAIFVYIWETGLNGEPDLVDFEDYDDNGAPEAELS
jgi:hypothetical protein